MTYPGRKLKLAMVICMLATAIFIIFYIWKKIRQRRQQMLRDSQTVERHAEAAILEEQHAAAIGATRHDTLSSVQETNEKSNVKHFQSYDDEVLWRQFSWSLVGRPAENSELAYSPSFKPAQIEVLLYYQSLTKLFKVVINSVQNVAALGACAEDFLRTKVILCEANGRQRVEKSSLYPLSTLSDSETEVQMKERFTFNISVDELYGSVLYISVWKTDVFHREILLGAISLDLSLRNITNKVTFTEELIPVRKDMQIGGFLLLSLCHDPVHERLICVIIRAKDLKDWSSSASSVLNNVLNPFVKIKLVCHGKTIKKHRTNCIMETKSPLFNEMIEYFVPLDQIKLADLILQIFSREESADVKHTLGRVTVGCHSEGLSFEHWRTTLSNPGHSVARWHVIVK